MGQDYLTWRRNSWCNKVTNLTKFTVKPLIKRHPTSRQVCTILQSTAIQRLLGLEGRERTIFAKRHDHMCLSKKVPEEAKSFLVGWNALTPYESDYGDGTSSLNYAHALWRNLVARQNVAQKYMPLSQIKSWSMVAAKRRWEGLKQSHFP